MLVLYAQVCLHALIKHVLYRIHIIMEIYLSLDKIQESTQVRLVYGSSPSNGKVEVAIKGLWGRICQSSWSFHEADVICGMLGYNRGVPTLSSAFQPGIGRIWLNDVRCHGEESDIQDCQHSDWGSYSSSCTSSTDAGVICFSKDCVKICNKPLWNICM